MPFKTKAQTTRKGKCRNQEAGIPEAKLGNKKNPERRLKKSCERAIHRRKLVRQLVASEGFLSPWCLT